MDTPRPLVALIAGPTASGKSALAVALAERHDGTVINADSAQVYRDLRILTARPSPAEEATVPHRLFGHVDGADTGYSAARWAAEAREAIDETVGAGRLPVLVGGTGMYLRTLLDGIAPVPPIDPEVRAAVRAMAVDDAHRALRQADPAAATRLAPRDTARVARALEVARSTGRTLTEWQAQRDGGIGHRIRLAPLILLPPRDWLMDRCDRRLEAMFAEGAVEEVRALLARPDLPADAPIRRAIGVPEIGAMLREELSPAAALEQAQRSTRQYAKRQFTWFRHQPPATWLRSSDYSIASQLGVLEQSCALLA